MPKPRIKLSFDPNCGKWMCLSLVMVGYGPTPKHAFWDWKRGWNLLYGDNK